MRFVTYSGLVVRRVWAKRGTLIGSFLGSAIVISLFVVVPLYEDSIKAVDLQFALAGAGDDGTAIVMNAIMNDFSLDVASENRGAIASNGEILEPWFSPSFEWLRSREFVVIPIEGATTTEEGERLSWLDLVQQWRDRRAAFVPETSDEVFEELPPYPGPPQEARQYRAWSGADVASRVRLVSGEWPEGVAARSDGNQGVVLEGVLGVDLANSMNVSIGDRFLTRPLVIEPTGFAMVEVVAIVEAMEPNNAYWGISRPNSLMFYQPDSFELWMIGVRVDPEIDPWGRQLTGFPGVIVNQRVRYDLNLDEVAFGDVPSIREGIAGMRSGTARDTLGRVSTEAPLTGLLDRFDTRSVVVGAPIQAILALVVGGAVYFLVYTASLTLEREGTELALLRSRGAGTWQTVGIHVAQSTIVTVGAAFVAPFLARALVAITGRVPPMSDLTGGTALSVAEAQSLRPFLIGGMILAFGSMGLAIVPFARRSVLELRILASRPTTQSIWQRYNLDLFAVALSVVVLLQLKQRGFIIFDGDKVELDPIAVVFPVLLLFTGALLLLRLLPFVLRAVGWTMTRFGTLSSALPGWHLSRNPVAYGRLALLVWLTSGLGAFALTYANTLNTSFEDRSVFESGADVRIVGNHAGYLDLSDDFVTTPVVRTVGGPSQRGRQAQVLAIDPVTFPTVAGWRDDYSPISRDAVFTALRPNAEAARVGVVLPDDATGLRFEGIVQPPTILTSQSEPDPRDSAITVVIKVMDARGRLWTMAAAEDLTVEEWRSVEIEFSTGLQLSSGSKRYIDPPEGPFEMHSMWFELGGNRRGFRTNGDKIYLDRMLVVTPAGEVDLDISELSSANGMSRSEGVSNFNVVRDIYTSVPTGYVVPTIETMRQDTRFRDGTSDVFRSPRLRTQSESVPEMRYPIPPLNVLVDEDVQSSAGLDVGSEIRMSVGLVFLDTVMVGRIDLMPTMTDNRFTGKIVFDQRPFVAAINGAATWSVGRPVAAVAGADELWIKTDDPDAAVRRATSALGGEPDEVFTARGSAADFAGRPVQIGLVAILFVGAVTSVVLALAGVVSYVLLAVSRRAREMGILRAMGFPRRGVALTFALEQIVVLGLGSVIGVYGGVQLMRLMVPFLQLGENAAVVEPTVRLAVAMPVLLGYVAVVAVLLVGAVVWATRRVSASQMSEVLREVER
jgi:FtsX-like permease family protein